MDTPKFYSRFNSLNGGTIIGLMKKRVPDIGNEGLLRPDPAHVK